MNIELSAIELAAERLKPILHHTELDLSSTFSAMTGGRVWAEPAPVAPVPQAGADIILPPEVLAQRAAEEQQRREMEKQAAAAAEKSKNKDASSDDEPTAKLDDRINEAVELICRTGRASTSQLQSKLGLGYARAARIMDQLEEM